MSTSSRRNKSVSAKSIGNRIKNNNEHRFPSTFLNVPTSSATDDLGPSTKTTYPPFRTLPTNVLPNFLLIFHPSMERPLSALVRLTMFCCPTYRPPTHHPLTRHLRTSLERIVFQQIFLKQTLLLLVQRQQTHPTPSCRAVLAHAPTSVFWDWNASS
jgi:hypothetical protein